jgi:hypothetical protein
MREVSIEYMAGLFDGEGCVTWQERYGNKNGTPPVPFCKIQMVDQKTLEIVYLTMKKYNVGTYMIKNLHSPSLRNNNRQPETHLVWAGALRARALLELLLPHLITKRRQSLALLAYIYSRHISLQGHSKRIKHGQGGKYIKGSVTPLTENELGLLRYIRELNKRGIHIPNEHTPYSDIEKMCSELYRKYTEVAEMTTRLEKG